MADPLSMVASLFGNLVSAENINKMVDQGVVKYLVEKIDKETIIPILITILAYQENDSTRTKAIEMLGEMASGKLTAN